MAEFYRTGKTKAGWQNASAVALRKLDQLAAAKALADMAASPGNRLEPLKGDREGQHSIRVTTNRASASHGPTPGRATLRSPTITGEDGSMTRTTYPAASLLDMKRITTHPGEMLSEEFLKPLNLSARALAKEIGVPANRLTEIIAKRRGMSADTAIRLARYFRTTAEFWMNLQSMYDLTKAVVKRRTTYAAIPTHKAA